ncbi:hypothetical protein BST27_09740 [Mycobacterium intermedium]|uniref:Uncharacterized protein n=1 Tax=Mycobacterium intermedium TaxID=28445 RepID=A0A1E3SC69_MYCIE|nr:hypothetical protein [Mycobacterium intermedium]MCV6966872.1 hypothetical protein [Mycobacterium intermedium]ODQ99684.1 hypothetical protein BHQ20_16180 [Mycobacterium intermedium]OPE49057.1 hypothetical protein BV508_15700 [Mycobacterium intermedium]ORB07190.1 hypothetical protein BST27_09740 [Mycobacterium intermedium]
MTIKSTMAFAGAFQEAVAAVLDALVTDGEERHGSLRSAKLAVEKAMRESHSNAEWFLADHLRRGIKDVEAHALLAA